MNAATPEQHDEALRRHAVGLRQHVKDLGDKNYPKAIGGDALDITIAFVPIEGALSAALGADGDLQSYAFDRKVVFASPNTLMALLRVTERLWTRDKVQKQALEISEVGGRVLDALTAFLVEFDTVGKRLDDAGKAFGRARNRLGRFAAVRAQPGAQACRTRQQGKARAARRAAARCAAAGRGAVAGRAIGR